MYVWNRVIYDGGLVDKYVDYILGLKLLMYLISIWGGVLKWIWILLIKVEDDDWRDLFGNVIV